MSPHNDQIDLVLLREFKQFLVTGARHHVETGLPIAEHRISSKLLKGHSGRFLLFDQLFELIAEEHRCVRQERNGVLDDGQQMQSRLEFVGQFLGIFARVQTRCAEIGWCENYFGCES